MENYGWIRDIFAYIGMIVCIIIALIAIVWATCFAVKLLIKTFAVRVGKSYDVMVEDISQKAEYKKQRKELVRKSAAEHKMELLNMKLESKQKIHDMKKQKLEQTLIQNEEKAKLKIFGGENVEVENENVEPEIVKLYEEDVNNGESVKTKKKSSKKKKETTEE